MRQAKSIPSSESSAGDQLAPPPVLREIAAMADVTFNGDKPWDIQVLDPDVYQRILRHGSLGFGESFMDGQWQCQAMDQLFDRLLSARIEEKIGGAAKFRLLIEIFRQNIFNLQSLARSHQVGEYHYDIGNDVFVNMLDPTMSYSCGYWPYADNLEQAQYDKLDIICQKLELKPGEKVLEIGCGWGSFAKFAAERYGVEVYGITISKEQQKLARERCAGLPVQIELKDYRLLDGTYDKIVSIGMFEHVGPKNYDGYFESILRLLAKDGLFLLHTIGSDQTTNHVDPWIDKYIFRNGKLPSAAELSHVLNGRLIIEDWHNFGPDYDKTLIAWWQRFEASWPELSQRYDSRFYRMWKYYLMSCAGFFRAKRGQLWQLVLSHPGRQAIYRSVR